MTGIYNLDNIIRELRNRLDENEKVSDYAIATDSVRANLDLIEIAVNEFLESKKSFYCTNTECPLKKVLKEVE